jgi:hypothetical protein
VQLGGGALAVTGIFLLSRSSIVAAETTEPQRERVPAGVGAVALSGTDCAS